jgi:branched-chain amino acid transport system ATP-binding protein
VQLDGPAAMVPSERFVFPDLTVTENLELGRSRAAHGTSADERMELVMSLFPLLEDRGGQLAGRLSGGQQRMVSIGMALLRAPDVLLLDEPSLGLAPVLVDEIFAKLRRVASDEGLTVVLVEQNVPAALRIADRVCVMRSGVIVARDDAAALLGEGASIWWELF